MPGGDSKQWTYRLWGILTEGGVAYFSGPVFVALLAWFCYTAWRKRVFIVTPDTVAMGYARGNGHITLHRWPRSSVGEIRYNRHSGKLLIRITGQDMQEYAIAGGPQVVEYVANVLQQALNKPAAPPS